MLDPSEFQDRYVYGDETTTGNPTGGPYGTVPGEIAEDCPPSAFEPTDIQGLAANAERNIRQAFEPAYWIVANAPVATSEIAVYHGPAAAGVPCQRLYPGQACKVPGRGTDLTVRNVGAATTDVHVTAVRGFDVWVTAAI